MVVLWLILAVQVLQLLLLAKLTGWEPRLRAEKPWVTIGRELAGGLASQLNQSQQARQGEVKRSPSEPVGGNHR